MVDLGHAAAENGHILMDDGAGQKLAGSGPGMGSRPVAPADRSRAGASIWLVLQHNGGGSAGHGGALILPIGIFDWTAAARSRIG
jgi:hypothetical protein